MKFSNKAQMEMIGLAIVVILVALGMFLLVRFTVLENPVQAKQVYTSKQLATNMIKTILDSNAACDTRNIQFNELVRAYAEQNDFTCTLDGTPLSIGEYLNKSIGYILNQTLSAWFVKYSFEINVPGDVPHICLAKTAAKPCTTCPCSTCIGNKDSERFPMPSDYGTIEVKLDICS